MAYHGDSYNMGQQSFQDNDDWLMDDISRIEEENKLWTRVHSYISHIITYDDYDHILKQCDYERHHDVANGLFKKEFPSESSSREQAAKEAVEKYETFSSKKAFFDAQRKLRSLIFDEAEPTLEGITQELEKQAAQEIKSFFTWKQKKLRKEFVESRCNEIFNERHSAWLKRKKDYDAQIEEATALCKQKEAAYSEAIKLQKNYVNTRTEELYQPILENWRAERNLFLEKYTKSLQMLVDGDKHYVLNVIDLHIAIDADKFPFRYLVEFAYDEHNGRVLVDLELPDALEVPTQRVLESSSGKKSVATKSQINLREDYALCICGLSMYVASLIFNSSLKIKEVEITGYTQHHINKSDGADEPYILLVNYQREMFEQIDFTKFNALEIIRLFKHYINLSPTFILREFNLGMAYEKMELYLPGNYRTYMDLLQEKEAEIEKRQAAIKAQAEAQAALATRKAELAKRPPIYAPPKGPKFSDFDPLFEESAKWVVSSGNTVSTSALQRRYQIGYNRAGLIMEQMFKVGIVGHSFGGRPRFVLVTPVELAAILNKLKN